MKKIFVLMLFAVLASAGASEADKLQNKFKKENLEADKILQKANTTVELTSAAGNNWHVAENQFIAAVEYKLRHTENGAERLKIIRDFYEVIREVQKIYDTPREKMGSIAGMQIYMNIASLLNQQTAVLLLKNEDAKRWRSIADAPLFIEGREIIMKRGSAKFKKVMYDSPTELEIMLFPHDTFSFRGRHFAVIRSDIPFAVTDDFSEVYLCELKDGKLQMHTKCVFPLFDRWELRGNVLSFIYQKKEQKIKL